MQRSKIASPVNLLAVGFVLSATAVVALTWLLGKTLIGHALSWSLVLVPMIALALADLAHRRVRLTPMIRRQTPQRWMYQMPPRLFAFLWGLDTGSMVTTYRASASSWALFILVFALRAPAWIGFAYGLAFAVPLWLIVSTQQLNPDSPTRIRIGTNRLETGPLVARMATLAPRLRDLSGLLLGLVCVLLAFAALK